MCTPVVRALLVIGVAALNPFDLGAQAPDRQSSLVKSLGACTSGLRGGGPECSLDRRLRIDLRRSGAGATLELLPVVGMGAAQGGAFWLTRQQATAADSLFYVILDVAREASGEHRIETSAIASGTKLPECAGVSTGKLTDLGFGAALAIETTQLVRCAQNARTKMTRKWIEAPAVDTKRPVR